MVINAYENNTYSLEMPTYCGKINLYGCSSNSDYTLHMSITDFTPLHAILQTLKCSLN